ncbi:MAG: hypothetical protein VX899_24260 [Myxococcota bacterium]|nr:hypothetical protein [Myxococcota bacterium]
MGIGVTLLGLLACSTQLEGEGDVCQSVGMDPLTWSESTELGVPEDAIDGLALDQWVTGTWWDGEPGQVRIQLEAETDEEPQWLYFSRGAGREGKERLLALRSGSEPADDCRDRMLIPVRYTLESGERDFYLQGGDFAFMGSMQVGEISHDSYLLAAIPDGDDVPMELEPGGALWLMLDVSAGEGEIDSFSLHVRREDLETGAGRWQELFEGE